MRFPLIICSFLVTLGFAQTVTPEVTSSSSHSGIVNGIEISGTIGEPIITTETGSSLIVTQGFHQPDDILESTPESLAFELDLYPNPATEQVILKFSVTQTFIVEIFDAAGKLVISESGSAETHQVDLTNLKRGVYHCKTTISESSVSHKIIKQ